MRRVVFVALAIALIGCGPADAESAWAAYGSLGINASRGITNTDSGAAKFAVSRELGRWVYNLGISGNYASNNGITTQEDERGRIGTTLTLSKHAFWFTDTLYDRNLFDGFAYQESVASGMGRMLLESKKNTLATELGVGYLREEPEALIYNNRLFRV